MLQFNLYTCYTYNTFIHQEPVILLYCHATDFKRGFIILILFHVMVIKYLPVG